MEQKQMSSDSANLTANYQYTHVNGSVPALAKQFAVGPAQCKKCTGRYLFNIFFLLLIRSLQPKILTSFPDP